ncbi:MAG TPA: patatin-like phospholipase family protein [Steroidobacteraceae bacterium]|jgi:NTE family protein|nr:patatin-like phospholipase family protein [Steroidobacteraceae bacterium]
MEGDIPEETAIRRSDLSVVFNELPLFKGLDYAFLREIAQASQWLSLPGGATLFSAGDPADALYVVLSGCLGVFSPAERRNRGLVGRVAAGGTVGEMGLISGRPRTAHVVALRDTELARLSSESFNKLFRQHPEAMLRIAQLTVDRLESSQSRARAPSHAARTFTLLPQSVEVDVGGFAAELVKALSAFGRTELVWNVRAGTHTSHWFHRIESANEYVVYVAEANSGRWSSLCVRQADALLLLARAEGEAGTWPTLGTHGAPGTPHVSSPPTAPRHAELVLMHDGTLARGAAARWLTAVPPGTPHHHVTSKADVPRVARILTGRGVGLVLSGGGARGFAHIGIVKALREADIPIDLVGGTSMGAILGAGVALCWSIDELTDRFRESFVDAKPLRDYTLPFVSLVSGHKVTRLLQHAFGDVTIEDLPLDFFCVSSNLTTGHSEVHRRGELWRWLRASVAIPGVLPPVVHKGELLVDGGTMNNLPVDAMRDLGRGPVIGCDVGADRAFTTDTDEVDVPLPWQLMRWMREKKHRPNIFQILWRAGMVNSNAMTAAHREKTDLLLQPPLAQIDMLNWKGFDRAIAAGYEYAVRRLEKLPLDSPLRQSLRAPD